MKHNRIARILALILVIALVVICIILAQPVRAAGQRIVDWPELPWEPDPEDVDLVSRTIWGECRGCPYEEQWAQGCCVVNRVDDPRWPDTIESVVLQPNQFQGYSPDNPVEPFRDMARAILIAWHNGDTGVPRDMCFCSGNGRHQRFRTTWLITEETEYWP